MAYPMTYIYIKLLTYLILLFLFIWRFISSVDRRWYDKFTRMNKEEKLILSVPERDNDIPAT